MSGAYNPHPLQFGAQSNKIIEQFQKGFGSALGEGIASESGTIGWLQNHAVARVLVDLQNASQRLANQWDPQRMTDFLPRWEKILGIVPDATASLIERRQEVALKLSLVGQPPTKQVIFDFLTNLLGDLFVDVINTSSSQAAATVPGGISIPGGVILADGDWRSSISHVAIETQKANGISDEDFYREVGKIYQYLHYLLPAWATFDWFLDGPNGIGFYLDEDFNLDNQRFD